MRDGVSRLITINLLVGAEEGKSIFSWAGATERSLLVDSGRFKRSKLIH
jgi:hypothetical protein